MFMMCDTYLGGGDEVQTYIVSIPLKNPSSTPGVHAGLSQQELKN